MSKVILVLFLLLITFIVVITILLVKKNIHKLPSTSVGGTSCWTGVGVQDCPSDEELKTTLASNINTTLCNQDGNGKWTCPDKILNKPLNGAPGKKIKDYLKCVCFGNGVCNAGECACNKDGNQGVDNSCAPAPTPAPPSAWFCTDPKTGTCKEEPIATGIQSGCASVNSSIKNGATTEEECKLSCFPKVKGKCSGDVGYCHDLPSDDNVSCGPDAKEEHVNVIKLCIKVCVVVV